MATSPPSGGPPRSAFSRSENIGRLRSEAFDVLVVGGGITGAGVALDAASRGLRTALVEKADFASGTSSKSSKLVHGGLRYLQQREYRLVYGSLAERQRLLENAPHLVSELPFLIPLFGQGGIVSKTVARSYSSALWLYDLTGGWRIGKRHRRISRAEAVAYLPLLDTEHLVAGFIYFDARTDDARLTLAVLRTAADGFGAVVANYAPATRFLRDPSGSVTGVEVTDLERPGDTAFEVRARAVVNATGVWTDEVRALGETGRQSLRPAKGVHLTVPSSRFPAEVAAVIPVRKDRRSIFAVPWAEGDRVYLGTTDTNYQGDLDDPRCTAEDVDYLLDAANAASSARLTRDDVTGVWAGLRPLLSATGDHAVSERTADLSRRHKVWRDDDGVITITGGKLTTYRKMAEDTVDLVTKALGERRRCVTKHLQLEGSPGRRSSERARPAAGVTSHLEHRYGTLAASVRALADGRPELLAPVADGLPYLGAEVLYAVRYEMAVRVADVLSRRTRATIEDARAAVRAAPGVAALMGEDLSWDEDRRAREAGVFVEAVEAELATAGLGAARDAARGERA